MSEQVVFTADGLIAAFGDQAYHKGVWMAVECLQTGDLESCWTITSANIELLKRGYHKKPKEY